jgi:hypothetical protein
MNPESHKNRVLMFFICAAFLAMPAYAQRTANLASSKAKTTTPYQLSREVSVQGTVVQFTADSATPPLGAHVVVRTLAGATVDVHLGDARFLQAEHMSIAAGDNIRIIGETLPYGSGTVFFARLVQKGTQVVAVRSTTGMPLWPASVHVNAMLATPRTGGAR